MTELVQSNSKAMIIFKAILFCIVFTCVFVVCSFAKNFFPSRLERLAHGLIGTLVAFFITAIFLKFDKTRFSDIGLKFDRKTILKFFAGALAGILIMGSLVITVLYFSNVKVEANPGSNIWHYLFLTLPLIPLAFMEELGFRAYPLQILKERTGIRLSIVITSILFALYHIANGWSITSSFYGPGIWGLVFGLAAVYSKGIAMPTGVHYAVNLTTSAFGEADHKVCLWTVRQTGIPVIKTGAIDWATILPAIVILVFAIICIELYVRQIKCR